MRVLQRRPTNLIDTWEQQRYHRVIRIDGKPLLIEVENRGSVDVPDVRLSVLRPADTDADADTDTDTDTDDAAAPAGGAVTARERHEAARITRAILGLDVDTRGAQRRAEAHPALREVALALRGLRPPRYPDLFETFANVVPFQQLSLEAGMSITSRLIGRFGQGLAFARQRRFAFPSATVVAGARAASLERCGLSGHKARALRSAARAIAGGTLTARAIDELPSSKALAQLTQLPGIGPWSAALILLRGFGRLDVFPPADTGAQSSLVALMHLRSRAELTGAVERFGEYRGLLYFYGLASRLLAAGLIHPAASGGRFGQ